MLYFSNTICAAQMSARPKSSNPFYEKLSIYVSPRVSDLKVLLYLIYHNKRQRKKEELWPEAIHYKVPSLP